LDIFIIQLDIEKGLPMRIVFLVVMCVVLLDTVVDAKEEVYITKDGDYVVVRTEERSSGRGWIRIGVAAILLACGGAAVASQRKFKRPKNRVRPGSATTAVRKPMRPTFNKPKNRT